MVRTRLHDAAKRGDVGAIRGLLAVAPGDAMEPDGWGQLPLHLACKAGHTRAAAVLLAAAAAAAWVPTCHKGRKGGLLPLHYAAEGGHMAVVQLLLDAAPAAASTGDAARQLPLHLAARRGHAAAVELLLAAAPGAASATACEGDLPLYWASTGGHADVVALLLAAAPDTERHRVIAGRFSLRRLAFHDAWRHLAVARVMLERSTAPPAEILDDLLAVGRSVGAIHTPDWGVLFADLAASRALSPADWARLPTPCPGLARALPAVLARSPAEAAQLVARLPDAARGRLRALGLSLQRRLRLELPESIVQRILAAAPLEEETVKDAESSGEESEEEVEQDAEEAEAEQEAAWKP
eukprot:scaffold8.g1698.t1